MPGLGTFRYAVLITVSATALMVALEGEALAADVVAPASDRWWLSVEGQYLLFDGDSALYGAGEQDSLAIPLKPKDGWGAGAEIGIQPGDSPWSFLGRLRYGESNKKDDDTGYFISEGERFVSSTSTADHRERHTIADLEIGRDVGLGALGDSSDIRLFGGVRFGQFKGKGSNQNNLLFSNPNASGSGYADVDFRRTFTGIGPRIGFDATVPLGDQFSFDMGAAGALLFGKQKLEVSGHGYNPDIESFFEVESRRTKSVVVPNLEANAAVSWLVTENAKFALGYRVDSYFGLYDMSGPFDDRDEGDRIIHGPFIKLTVGGGG